MDELWDAVFLDLRLPGIDGLETTRRIRQRLAGRPLLIVALTAKPMDDGCVDCMAAGMDDFITNPEKLTGTAKTLGRLLQAARAPALKALVHETQKTRSERCGLKINAASALISCGRGSFHPRC